jgi:hypothetical protein
MFEALIGASIIVGIVAGFLNVASAADITVMLAVFISGVIFMNVLHGYLLAVRFSAVAIMRHNVGEI